MLSFFSAYATALKIGGVILLLIGAIALYHSFKIRQQDIGYQRAVAEYREKEIAAERAARVVEDTWRKKEGEALNVAKIREQKIIKLSADIAVVNKRLRDQVADNERSMSTATRDSLNKYATTLGAVLGECTDRYKQMGENAAREQSEKMMLADAWPK